MAMELSSYDFIVEKINAMKNQYPSLRNKSDDYVFSALCLKSNFYKNPALIFNEEIIKDAVVDGKGDGGVDILFSDPNSETADMIICQSKFYNNIQFDDVANAIHKMIDFYKTMEKGNYESVNPKVQKRFLDLNSEIGEESKVYFVFYTSSPKNSIRNDRLFKIFNENFKDVNNVELVIYFGKDIEEEIKEAESRRPYVERGKLKIDRPRNILEYGDQAIIVNVSAFSLKELYSQHNTNLLSRNLRYYIRKKDIDTEINNTIEYESDSFWFKNNGITIICEDFEVSGNELKLSNFSIVNGGQTTTLINKNKLINKEYDFYLPCKVIMIEGETEDEKNKFSLAISKATNSQKAIKPIDLKANAPEQVRFSNSMREVGVFYQTKRGEEIPKRFKEEYLNSDLAEIGKLCLSGIFQLPATSRSKPSTLYQDKYYNFIFDTNQKAISMISKDLLYVDYYFRKVFLSRFDKKYNGQSVISFAHNSRTLCLAFVSLASRYSNNQINEIDLIAKLNVIYHDKYYDNYLYDFFRELNGFNRVFNQEAIAREKDKLEDSLFNLFEKLILEGVKLFSIAKIQDSSLNETNYLKNDRTYFQILAFCWNDLKTVIKDNSKIF